MTFHILKSQQECLSSMRFYTASKCWKFQSIELDVLKAGANSASFLPPSSRPCLLSVLSLLQVISNVCQSPRSPALGLLRLQCISSAWATLCPSLCLTPTSSVSTWICYLLGKLFFLTFYIRTRWSSPNGVTIKTLMGCVLWNRCCPTAAIGAKVGLLFTTTSLAEVCVWHRVVGQ